MMIYGAADNNADGPILDFLEGVRTALDDEPGMELVLFIDRSAGFSDDATLLGEDFTGARVNRLRTDSAERLDAGSHFPGMEAGDLELDSADPANLERFIALCKQRFPARRYGLMIYSHADGCTMCPDEQSGGDMHIPALSREVDASASVDFLALELCNMGGAEIAYEWRPGNGGFSADVLVAIPNAGPPLDWARAFARIRSPGHASSAGAVDAAAPKAPGEGAELLDPAALSPRRFGELIVEEGYRGRQALLAEHPDAAERLGREAAACYDLEVAERVKLAVDTFARELSLQEGSKDLLEALRDGTGDGAAEPVLNYVHEQFGERPYVDLNALALRASACEELDRETREAARALAAVVDELVVASFGMDGLAGFEPGASGLFIAFPDGDREEQLGFQKSSVWSRMRWYTPLAPEADGEPYGRWAFLADGSTPGDGEITSWFELLDYWFDEPLAGTGGHNRYEW
jgi:clostripain